MTDQEMVAKSLPSSGPSSLEITGDACNCGQIVGSGHIRGLPPADPAGVRLAGSDSLADASHGAVLPAKPTNGNLGLPADMLRSCCGPHSWAAALARALHFTLGLGE
jgi:hypothetical protein